MGFNFFKKAEEAPKKTVDADVENVGQDVELTEAEKKEGRMFGDGFRQVQNEIEVFEKISITKDNEEEKKWLDKTKKTLVIFCCGMTMFAATGCHSRSVGNQFQRALLHGRTVDEIERRDRREVSENDSAQQKITRDEIKKIRNSGLPPEVKRQLIERLTGIPR